MSWYDTSYRKLFFDFHSPGSTVGLASRFDAERWAERVRAARAQAVSVFTKCGYGWSFYRKGSVRYVHPHLPAGLDMLGEQIDSLHKRGIRAIGYYHTFQSEPVARDHPQWRVRRPGEDPANALEVCMAGPLVREWMIPHIEEIVGNYDVDSMFFDGTRAQFACSCDACRSRYAAERGGELPRDREDPRWSDYVRWKLGVFEELRAEICSAIHRVRPEVVVSFNWVYAPFQPEIPPESVGALVADVPPDDQISYGSYLSRSWNTLRKPFDVMNSAFLQWWGDWGCKPASGMKQEVATVLANGGLTWIGYQMNQAFDVEDAVMGELGKTLAFVEERESLFAGARAVPHVAVLHGTRTREWSSPLDFGLTSEKSLRGTSRALTESMIPFQILNEKALGDRLADYRAVIMADQQILSPELVARLPGWVESGGVLLCAGLTGTRNQDGSESGSLALGRLLGLELDGVYDQPHAYVRITDPRLVPGTLDMPHLAETRFAFAKPAAGDVEVLARLHRIYLRSDGKFLLRWSPVGEDSGYPAVTMRRVGKGYACWIAGDVFHAYQVKNQWNLKHLVANLLGATLGDAMIRVRSPAWLEVALAEQVLPGGRRRTLIHLVNWHGNRPAEGTALCIEETHAVADIEVHYPCAPGPASVRLEPDGVKPRWCYDGGVLRVSVPRVEAHVAIAVQHRD